MDLIDRDTLDDTFLRLNEDGWELTRYEHKRMESVLFEMPTVEAIPLNVIEEIKTEIENSSCGSWYVETPDKTLEKVVLLRMVDVLDIIDKKVKEHTK